jgi:hypothetical protein
MTPFSKISLDMDVIAYCTASVLYTEY